MQYIKHTPINRNSTLELLGMLTFTFLAPITPTASKTGWRCSVL